MEMKKRCLFSEVEDILYDMKEEECYDEAIAEQGEDYYVMVTDPFVYMPSQNLYFAEMMFYQQTDEGEYEVDWDGAAVFKLEGGVLKLIGYEQDSLILTAHNILTAEGKDVDVKKEKVTIMTLSEMVEMRDAAATEAEDIVGSKVA